MQLVAIEKEALDRLFDKLEELTQAVKERIKEDVFEQVFTHEEAARYLKISKQGLHNMKGTQIPYSQYGKKLLYKKEDLDAFLDQNRVGGGKK